MNLSQQTILHCAPELEMRIDSSNDLHILIGDNGISVGPHGLLVLDTFATPRSLSDGLARMRNSVVGMQDWIDLTTAVGQLYESGVLCAEDETAKRSPDVSLYLSIEDTLSAYNDIDRVNRMVAAIREAVRPGDAVLDLSGGPGIFAIASAKAGARSVYAVDDGSYSALAQAAFVDNGVAEQIKVFNTLPKLEEMIERADVLILDPTINSFIFQDGLHVTLNDRRGMVKPNVRVVPEMLRLNALPVTIPETALRRQTFTADVVANWHEWYNIDFSPFVEVAANSTLLYPLKLYDARDWSTLAEPIVLAETNPLKLDTLPHIIEKSFVASSSGTLNGVILYMDVDCTAFQKIRSNPAVVTAQSYSYGFYWAFDNAIEVQVGDQLSLSYGMTSLSKELSIGVTRVG